MDQSNAMDQHVIKMVALGRKFQLGDLYNYCTDHILTGNLLRHAVFTRLLCFKSKPTLLLHYHWSEFEHS